MHPGVFPGRDDGGNQIPFAQSVDAFASYTASIERDKGLNILRFVKEDKGIIRNKVLAQVQVVKFPYDGTIKRMPLSTFLKSFIPQLIKSRIVKVNYL
jgi:hypothetical protein